MYRNLVGFGKINIRRMKKRIQSYRGGVEMTGKGELWHTKEEEGVKCVSVSESVKHRLTCLLC